jgi:glucose-6-phosphate 1-dehydrogenase
MIWATKEKKMIANAPVLFGATGDLGYKKIFPLCRRW